MKIVNITLQCGVQVEKWTYKGEEFLKIDLEDLYIGNGKLNNFELLSKLFEELSSMGYKGNGISLQYGCYDSIDALYLDVNRKL